MRKVKMNVQGRVQGVGFRYMTKMVADQLGVTGTVKTKMTAQSRSKQSAMTTSSRNLLKKSRNLRAQVDECSMWMSKKTR